MAYRTQRRSRLLGRQSRGSGGKWRLIPVALFAIYGIWFWFSNQEEVPVTGREQLVELSREQEAELGLQSYRQVLSQEQVLSDNSEAAQTVREISAAIIRAAAEMDLEQDMGWTFGVLEGEPQTGPTLQWDANLIQSDQANAFALPGGKIAVYTGILPIAGSENGLAIIIGHEVAHVIARHGAERMALQKLTQMGTLAAGVAVADMSSTQQRAILGALGAGAALGLNLPFSRKHESEADYIGLMFAARACFDPREAPELWQRMGEAGGARPPEWQSTHPSSDTRIRQFQQWMPEALEVRRQHCG